MQQLMKGAVYERLVVKFQINVNTKLFSNSS